MAGGFGDYLITRIRVGTNGDGVGHSSTRHEEACFLAKHSREPVFESYYRVIITEDIVAYFGFCHRFTHRGGRLCHCVGA